MLAQPAELTIIDPGYPGSHRAIFRHLASRGFKPSDLQWVILTHHHVDHAGTALKLCRETGARLAAHGGDVPYLGRGRPRERMTGWGLLDRLPVGLARFLVTYAGRVERVLQDNDTVAGLRVIHAPGHTPGSICLWSERESALFLGDVLNNERGLQRPPWTVNHHRQQARAAPARLLGLHYEHAYFGHGPALHEGASQKVSHFVRATV